MIEIKHPHPDTFARFTARDFDLDELVDKADRVIAVMRGDVALAEQIGDAKALEVTRARLARAEELRDGATVAIAALEQGEGEQRAAVERVMRATAMAAAGTTDDKQAIKQHDELIAACAAERAWRTRILPLRTAATSPLSAIARLSRDDEGRARDAAFEETNKLVAKILARYDAATAPDLAIEYGAKASARQVAFWPLAEAVAMVEFRAVAEPAGKAFDAGMTWKDGSGHRHDKPPTVADLEALFQTRRDTFEGQRRAVRQRAEELSA